MTGIRDSGSDRRPCARRYLILERGSGRRVVRESVREGVPGENAIARGLRSALVFWHDNALIVPSVQPENVNDMTAICGSGHDGNPIERVVTRWVRHDVCG